MMRKVPSLVDLCVQTAIDNIRYLGDVGETDSDFLERILSHCEVDQLRHIENCTKDRDLSHITDKSWKRFYNSEFGEDSTKIVVKRMEQRNVTFKWRQLYEAKKKEREEATEKSIDRLRQRYQEASAKKQSRQVRLCSKLPPSSKKRSYFGDAASSNIYNTRSSLMKKAKIEFVNSREVKNIAAMKNKMVHTNHSVSSIRKPSVTSGIASPSSSKLAKPIQRRF